MWDPSRTHVALATLLAVASLVGRRARAGGAAERYLYCPSVRAYVDPAPLSPLPAEQMPLAVISHGSVASGTYPDGWPGEPSGRLWSLLQDEPAALEPGSRHVVATRSDHDIQHLPAHRPSTGGEDS